MTTAIPDGLIHATEAAYRDGCPCRRCLDRQNEKRREYRHRTGR